MQNLRTSNSLLLQGKRILEENVNVSRMSHSDRCHIMFLFQKNALATRISTEKSNIFHKISRHDSGLKEKDKANMDLLKQSNPYMYVIY